VEPEEREEIKEDSEDEVPQKKEENSVEVQRSDIQNEGTDEPKDIINQKEESSDSSDR